ncbi:Protein of uncharacterised function DUF72 [Legionella wadsworthii]|uniref:Protein of uncharacterized function DUF72 n=1 Tax=Legionella wadsworthii TaxID=28088 RepID=A0A378LUY2_9GAMM|nr:DUF72 domain-containing protein [Legionella wadsworthii]STY29639.1 Protein of uncharacterised function DUF72 [Legionella wadsworthii]
MKKLFTNLSYFGEKIGPILFQLPPRWHKNIERFGEFIKQLTKDYRYAFEFRDRTWLDEDVYELLREYNIASCFYDFKAYQAPEIVTSDLIYIRLHGPHAAPYTGSYSRDKLAHYATKIHNWEKEGKLVYCYFDNDQNAYAPRDSQRLIEFLEKYSSEEQT